MPSPCGSWLAPLALDRWSIGSGSICNLDLSHLVCVRAAAEFFLSSSFASRGGFFFRWRAQCFFVLAALPVEVLVILVVGAEYCGQSRLDLGIRIGWIILRVVRRRETTAGSRWTRGYGPPLKPKARPELELGVNICFFLSRLTRDCE